MSNNLRYYDIAAERRALEDMKALEDTPKSRYSDYFSGRAFETVDIGPPKRFEITEHDVVAETESRLLKITEDYYRQLNDWRPDLKFRHLPQVKILDQFAHLGYAAITQGTIPTKDGPDRAWIFYFANFNAHFGTGDTLFADLNSSYGATFFALALLLNENNVITGRDLRLRNNGVLFSTKDPAEAFSSIVRLRDIQKSWMAHEADLAKPKTKSQRAMKTFHPTHEMPAAQGRVQDDKDLTNLLLII